MTKREYLAFLDILVTYSLFMFVQFLLYIQILTVNPCCYSVCGITTSKGDCAPFHIMRISHLILFVYLSYLVIIEKFFKNL